jgi:hypothetical protein
MRKAKIAGEPNFYIMDLGGDRLIDAEKKGGVARFLNSSCDPNCETSKWHEAGSEDVRVGIFAKRDIDTGEELTYDYLFEHAGTQSMAMSFKCKCGAKNCRGTMDKRPERFKNLGRRVEVQWDDGRYYRGTITGFNKAKGIYTVVSASWGSCTCQGGSRGGGALCTSCYTRRIILFFSLILAPIPIT